MRRPEAAAPWLGERPAGGVPRLLSGWMVQASRWALVVLVASALLTAVAGYYAATSLKMNTDVEALLSPDLPHRKIYHSYLKAFPQYDDTIVIVIEGQTPDAAEDGAAALAKALRARNDLFYTVFYPKGEAFFRQNGLLFLSVEELQDLADRLAEAQPFFSKLSREMSLKSLFEVLGQAAEAVVDGEAAPAPLVRVYENIADTLEARLQGRDVRLSWRELMEEQDATEGRELIVVQPTLDYSTLAPAEQAIAAIRKTAASLNLDQIHGVSVRLTGGVPLREEEFKSVRDGMGLAGVISLVLVSALVFLGLRSLRLMLSTLATLLMGLVWTAAFAALSIGHLNLLSVGFAVLFIGLAVDFSLQLGLRYREGVDRGLKQERAFRDAAARTGPAMVLAAVCAALGFFAFVPTAYVGLSELGVIAGAGMFIGLFGALTVLPAILTLMPLHRRRRPPLERGGGASIGAFILAHARTIRRAALAVGGLSLGALPFVRFDFDPINLRDPNTESVQTYLDLSQDGSTSPYAAKVVAPNLKAAVEVAHRLEQRPEVDKTVSLRSFLPKEQEAKLEIIETLSLLLPSTSAPSGTPPSGEPAAATAALRHTLDALRQSPNAGPLAAPAQRLAGLLERFSQSAGRDRASYKALEDALLAHLPARLEQLEEALHAQRVTLDDLPQDLRARYVSPDGRALIQVLPAGSLTDQMALRRFVSAVQAVAPQATGHPVVLIRGADAIIHAFQQAGFLAILTIATVVLVVLRSLRGAILVLAPLALAALLTTATTVVAGVPFNFANIIALPLLFSLGVAFGIYLVLRYREGLDLTELLQTSTPRAILFSALTTMASFGSLMVSTHRGTASMGELLTLSLSLALACTLIVLPALLARPKPSRRPGRRPKPHALSRAREASQPEPL